MPTIRFAEPTYAQALPGAYVAARAAAAPAPRLVRFNWSAMSLGLDVAALDSDAGARPFAGARPGARRPAADRRGRAAGGGPPGGGGGAPQPGGGGQGGGHAGRGRPGEGGAGATGGGGGERGGGPGGGARRRDRGDLETSGGDHARGAEGRGGAGGRGGGGPRGRARAGMGSASSTACDRQEARTAIAWGGRRRLRLAGGTPVRWNSHSERWSLICIQISLLL